MSLRWFGTSLVLTLAACDKETPRIDDTSEPPAAPEVDADEDGFVVGEDCNDGDARIFPAAEERCNGIDDDCDDAIDEDLFGTFYRDADGDGFGDEGITSDSCVLPGGFAEVAGDCNDQNPAINPGVAEKCDLLEVDDDCDGLVNAEDDGVLGALLWFSDGDGDGYGDPATAVEACAQVPGLVSQGTDCNDEDPSISPAADEVCDPKDVDEDCDTFSDESDPEGPLGIPLRYYDGDGDGYGDEDSIGQYFCDGFDPAYVTLTGDCDDTDIDIRPFRYEDCDDGKDNDCNGDPDDCGPVDPVPLNTADVAIQGEATYGYLGNAIDLAGDVDGDGDPDLVIGAPYDASYSGKAYVVDGADDGLLSDVYQASFTGATMYGYYGTSVSSAGDVDNDGYDDIVMSGYYYKSPITVFKGPVSGDYDADDADAEIIPGGDYTGAGWSIDGGYDANGDGFDDVLIGAPYRGTTTTSWEYIGAVSLVYGPFSSSTYDVDDPDLFIWGEAYNDYMGYSVSFAGDVNADGLDDLVMGALYADAPGLSTSGKVYIVYGGREGSIGGDEADVIIVGDVGNAYIGHSVSGRSDQNADGYDDVMVGAPYRSMYKGSAGVFEGPFTGGGETISFASADGILTADKNNSYLGHSVRGGGDVNGDGWGDWVVGAPSYNDSSISGGSTYAGAAFVVRGPLEGTLAPADVRARLGGPASDSGAGIAVSFAGDQDDDGREDIAVGAPYWSGPKGGWTYQGGVFVVFADRL